MSWYAVIPSDILCRKDLSANEKLLVGLIQSLSHQKGHCFASNLYMGDCLGVSSSSVRQYLKILEDKNIISRDLKKKESGEVEIREIKLVTPLPNSHYPSAENSLGGIANPHYPSSENSLHNNKEIIKENKKEEIVNNRFDEFWELYGKKVGKEKAKSNWLKLKEKEKDECLLAIPKYTLARPDPIYRKDPERFLKNRVWEDEIIGANTPIKSEPLDKKQFELIIPEKWL